MSNGRIRLGGATVFGAEDFHRYREAKSLDEIELDLIDRSFFGWEARQAAEEWVRTERAREQRAHETELRDLSRRATKAAEKSAVAAGRSAKWSMWSIVLAAAALIVSAWPHFKTPPAWWPF